MIYIEIIPTSSPVPSSTVMSPTGTPANPSDTAIIIVWGVVPPVIFVMIITGCVIMVIVAAGLIKKKRRKRDKRNRHRYLQDDTPMIHLPKPNFASKVSVISKGHRLENFTKPMFVRDISECLAFPAKLHAEYMSIPPNMTSMDEIPPGAQDKNRYTDVLPNPNSRVVLFLKFGKANSDYINANYIRGFRGLPKSFIATQGPLAYTIADFWRMVWEQKATVIIMLTDLIEKNKVKCEQYWPTSQGNTEIYQEIQVFTRKIENCGKYILTTLIVHHLERNVKREVYHYWYKEWPNVGVPENAQSMVDFLLETRRTREYFSMPGPTIVHCSAGIGRTGVFIAADIGMRELEEMRSVDVVRIVASLRQDRGGMVQTKDQYIFLHKVFFEYAKRMGHVMPVVRGVNDEDSDSCSSHSSIQLNTFLY
jgi:protein tyrosine phosphatase